MFNSLMLKDFIYNCFIVTWLCFSGRGVWHNSRKFENRRQNCPETAKGRRYTFSDLAT